uniref:Uncharacterized protein n=1 Tax=Anguilla anguilla TaxID=7936 RepID=A0A0E9UAB3_ANGAN
MFRRPLLSYQTEQCYQQKKNHTRQTILSFSQLNRPSWTKQLIQIQSD